MQIELKYMIINYSKDDELFIKEYINYLEQVSKEIIDFFGIVSMEKKIQINIWNDLENFRNYYQYKSKEEFVAEWVCGFSNNGKVEVLSIEEYKKTKGHEKMSNINLAHLILHEFVHACHNSIVKEMSYIWLNEGLATTLSHQCDNHIMKFDATFEDVKGGAKAYYNYHTMFSYVLDNYGRDYILELIHNRTLMENETPRLYDEVKAYVDSKVIK